MGVVYTLAKYIVGGISRVLFLQKAIGKENIPKKGGIILCCNHTHFLDVVFLIVAFNRRIHFMAKAELFKNRFIAAFLRKMGAFPVERGTGGASAIETATNIVNSGKVMGIFPEGTRSPDGKPHKAKSGTAVIAASTGADILPASIYYDGKMRIFKKVTVRIGKPISYDEIKMTDNSRGEIRRVSSVIMDTITSQWEQGHAR